MVSQRPGAISAICVIWVLALIYELLMILPHAGEVANWFLIYTVCMLAGWATSLYGIWTMKKWGLVVFSALFGVNQFVLFAGDVWNYNALLLPVLVLAVGYAHFNRMT